jgi:hypothetical protein
MTIGHRTNRLKLVGIPAVEQLQNGRYQLTVNCTPLNRRDAWYNSNKSRIFPDYGSLQSAEMSIDGLAPRTGEAYTDMRLVSVQSSTQGEQYIVTLVYQTLGSSFVQIKDDTIDLELNGLRRVTRTSIAQAGTDIPVDDKDIGVDYINHQIDSETAVRCFLSSYEIDDTDSYREFERTYIQAGELSRDIRSVGRGVQQTTHQFLVTEGTTTGDVISRDTDNFLGLKRITVSVIARPDGATLTNADGSAKLSYSQQQLVPFTFPGVVDLQDEQKHIFPAVRSPVEAKVVADLATYYQSDTSNIVSGDFTTQSALGLWNPSEWCQKISTIGASQDKPAYFNAQGIRGCRTRESFTLSGNLQESLATNLQYTALGQNFQLSELMLEETVDVENGKSVFRQVFDYFFDVTERFDFQNVGGVNVFRPGDVLAAKGTFTIEVKWTGSQWQLTGTNVVVDQQPTASAGSPAVTYIFSRAANSGAGGFLEGYTNRSGDQGSVSVTATGGGTNPSDATWPTGTTASVSSNTEEYVRVSTPASTLTAGSVAATFSYIEGRAIEDNAVGKIKISGGPPDPLGKVYTLDVNLEKVFTKLDGTDVYRKTITTATCTPA